MADATPAFDYWTEEWELPWEQQSLPCRAVQAAHVALRRDEWDGTPEQAAQLLGALKEAEAGLWAALREAWRDQPWQLALVRQRAGQR